MLPALTHCTNLDPHFLIADGKHENLNQEFTPRVLRSSVGAMRFLISAGEASGETYGGQLIGALRRRVPDASFFGVGSERMRADGFDCVVDAREISVLGLTEVVSHLPKIYGEFRRLLRAVDQDTPDAAVLIDFPDFNFRLARQLHRRGIPVFYFVSPQLWAWRQGRIKLVQKYIRKMLVIFPFEEAFYRERGVEAEYVGHPLADVPLPSQSRGNFAEQYGLDPEKQWIALLPGSRRKEVLMNLPETLRAASLLSNEATGTGTSFQFVLPVATTLDAAWVADLTRGSDANVTLTNDARASLLHARVAIVASGTATVEAALIGTPFVMVYRVSDMTWKLGRRLVTVPHFGMVNLIAGREVVPEIVQSDFRAENVAARLRELIPDGGPRERMLRDLAEVQAKLRRHSAGEDTAASRAAAAILRGLA
jgi:lipid-A-disaccharide synthase